MNICGERIDLPFFSRKNDRKKEKTWFHLRQTYSQTQLDDIAHEQTILCRELN